MILWELENSSYIPDFFRFAYFAYIQNLKDQLGHFSIFWWIFWYILIGWFWVYFELLKLENRTFFIFSVPHLELNLMILACCTLAMCSKTTNDLDLKLQTCINESLVKIWKKWEREAYPYNFVLCNYFFLWKLRSLFMDSIKIYWSIYSFFQPFLECFHQLIMVPSYVLPFLKFFVDLWILVSSNILIFQCMKIASFSFFNFPYLSMKFGNAREWVYFAIIKHSW